MSRISIDISCDPGYAISSEDPTTCVACQPGQYNLPELLDQVWLLCLTPKNKHALLLGNASTDYSYSAVQIQCLPCPIGSFCDELASTSFQACLSGSYQVKCSSRYPKCGVWLQFLVGACHWQYQTQNCLYRLQDTPGAAACSPCDDEAMYSSVGAISRRECQCPVSFALFQMS